MTDLNKLKELADRRYDEGSPGAARVLWLEIIESLEAQNAKLERYHGEDVALVQQYRSEIFNLSAELSRVRAQVPRWLHETDVVSNNDLHVLRWHGNYGLVVDDIPPPPASQTGEEKP